jgi:hypothetical protein
MIHTYYYLATVYRKHAAGLDVAADEAARYAAAFIDAGIPVFSPIAHGHAIATYSKTPRSAQFWADLQFHFMKPADGLIVVQMDGWTVSRGIRFELKWFREVKRPIVYVTPHDPVKDFRKVVPA